MFQQTEVEHLGRKVDAEGLPNRGEARGHFPGTTPTESTAIMVIIIMGNLFLIYPLFFTISFVRSSGIGI